MEVRRNDNDLSFLLMRFNQRDSSAFAKIYTKLFMELHVYAVRFYCNTSDSAEDAVQEAFCYLWERQNVKFDSLEKIKAFLYVTIKNRYKNRLNHWEVEQKYKNVVERESEFLEDVLESELATSLLESVERIPDPGGKVMKLYLNGYEAEEIADRLQMSIHTVYNTKSRAIGMLKKFFALNIKRSFNNTFIFYFLQLIPESVLFQEQHFKKNHSFKMQLSLNDPFLIEKTSCSRSNKRFYFCH